MIKKKMIFIVEDDPDICDLFKILLEDQGFKTTTFSDIKDFEKEIKLHKPDLMIMDVYVHGEDGASMTKNLKNRKETANIPIILVSAKNSLEKIAKESGADDFVSKPFEVNDLISIVRKHLQLH